MFQMLIRRSSAERYVSPSELNESELMWYACPLAKVRFSVAVATDCTWLGLGLGLGLA